MMIYFLYSASGYLTIGCYKDSSRRAIRTLEGSAHEALRNPYKIRRNPITKCAQAAIRAGYSMFAVQNGGQCFASDTAAKTFDKYGKSTACKSDGEGGRYSNQVYVLSKGKQLVTVPAECN